MCIGSGLRERQVHVRLRARDGVGGGGVGGRVAGTAQRVEEARQGPECMGQSRCASR